MSTLNKFANNLINRRLIDNLGWLSTTQYWLTFVYLLPQVIRSKDLRPVDQAMAGKIKQVEFNRKTIYFDCVFADEVIQDGSYCFGLIREIFIRNCYFKFLPEDALQSPQVVVDLGANRGVFTMLAACFAKQVLAIETRQDFREVILHNAIINKLNNIDIETVFVGTGGAYEKSSSRFEDFLSILDRYDIATIDILKIDIEGSEFGLFANPDWLSRVNRLCMEVHPRFGNVSDLVIPLQKEGFKLAFADVNLQQVTQNDKFEFLYAWR